MVRPSGTLLIAILASCGSRTTPRPSTSAPATQVTADAMIANDAAVAQPELSDTPMHRELAWLIEVIGKRQGAVEHVELEAHWSRKLGGFSERSIVDSFHRWGSGATTGVIDKLEVDDPTYVLAHITFGAKRWKVIVTLDPATNKIDYIRNDEEGAP